MSTSTSSPTRAPTPRSPPASATSATTDTTTTAPPPILPPPTLYPAATPIPLSLRADADSNDSNDAPTVKDTYSDRASTTPPPDPRASLLMNVSGASVGSSAAAAAVAGTALAVATSPPLLGSASSPASPSLIASSAGSSGSSSSGAGQGSSSGASSASATKPKRPYPFVLGGLAASAAACCTHPLDLAKNRMQTAAAPAQGKTALSTTKTLLAVIRPGAGTSSFQPLALYTGLSASLTRQFSYSLVRFGAYDALKARLASEEERTGQKRMGVGKSVLCASLAGAVGGVAGNPADILLVRMTSDANLPPNKRYNYANAIVGLVRMAREEGLSSYARGLLPNTVRAVLMNASQLATYDVFKDWLLGSGLFRDGIVLHFTASFCAGTVATTVCSPADVIKARVMSSSSSGGGGLGALRQALQKEGPAFLFRGFVPAWIRLSPNTVITFITLERLRMMVDWQRERSERATSTTATDVVASAGGVARR